MLNYPSLFKATAAVTPFTLFIGRKSIFHNNYEEIRKLHHGNRVKRTIDLYFGSKSQDKQSKVLPKLLRKLWNWYVQLCPFSFPVLRANATFQIFRPPSCMKMPRLEQLYRHSQNYESTATVFLIVSSYFLKQSV